MGAKKKGKKERVEINNVTRRDFLKTSSVVGAATLAGTGIFGNGPWVFHKAYAEEKGAPLKIGTCNPLSGPVALWGVSQRRCAELWAEEVNANGGLLVNGVRHPIELPRGDTQGLPEVARTVAERLIYKDKVKFIVGPNVDPTYTAVRTVCTPEKVVNFGATFDPTNVGPDYPYAVAIMWMAHQTGPIMYEYFKNEKDVKKIAFITKDEPGARMSLKKLISSAEAMGLEVIGSAFYAQGTTDMYPQATKVLAGKPDVIDSPLGSPEELGLICKAARELGFKGIISEETEGDVEVTCSIAGPENCEGLYFNAGSYDPKNVSTKMQAYYDRYVEKFGVWNPDAPTKLYTTFVMGAMIQRAGTTTDTDAFMKAFQTMQLKTPYLKGDHVVRGVGLKEFGINNQIGVPLCLAQIQKGEAVVIYTHFAEPEEGIQYAEPYEFIW
jgi:branched-chain amino acid transport system substrate-binding protein